jgi:dTDP-4-dehydrorhamnose 3,5-epimerase
MEHLTYVENGPRRCEEHIAKPITWPSSLHVIVGFSCENMSGKSEMELAETNLKDVYVVTPRRFGDHRGFFSETWNRKVWEDAGINCEWVQDNHSLSAQAGTLRGLHFQAPPKAQDKLVRVVSGAVFDVAVDIRVGSPSYGKWVGVELSAENGRQLYIPKGFLHGFVTLQPNTQFVYKCSDYYDSEADGGIRWDDPTIGIEWGVDLATITLSDKDKDAIFLTDFVSPFSYKGL